MPTPAKPFTVLQAEKKSHRTKAELAQRKVAENAMLSGERIKESPEVKSDPKAHKEFVRIKKLLMNVEKNDAIYEQSINRYCLLLSEELSLQKQIKKLSEGIEQLDSDKSEFDDVQFFYKTRDSMQQSVIKLDKQLQDKRKLLLSLEKENAMTIASALRTIPKKPEAKSNPLLEALGGV